ncbi:hypothetical protein [Cecembia calidifontis]|jgi:hypothetical protein|uniref:Uncharacterized protein n=1 Tax=Cecembia calidifontis TaxID=1187080 RepID=A0A4Q7P424_9BACT|nr:hypothetical protein [Cecembia calidifontis]RZS94693.1 hypothetical protein BC751_0200 [Cecembia calidifontis]
MSVYRLFFIPGLIFLIMGCSKEDEPIVPSLEPIEMVIADNEGATGLEMTSNKELLIYNFNQFTKLSPKADYLFQVVPTKHGINSLELAGDMIVIAGKAKGGALGNLGVSAYTLAGSKLWELEFEAPGNEIVESVSIEWYNNRLWLFYVSGSEQTAAPYHKSIPITEIGKDGGVLSSSVSHFTTNVDYFANTVLIQSDKKFLIQGSRKISQGNTDEGILVFQFENQQLKWQNELGFPGFETITRVKENASGGIWLVGSRQTIAWAVELDPQGNKISEINFQLEGSEKNWFYDVEFTPKGNLFCGFTSQGADGFDQGLLVLNRPDGSNIWQRFGVINNHNKLYAIRKRNDEDIVFAGTLLQDNSNLRKSWIFSRPLDFFK